MGVIEEGVACYVACVNNSGYLPIILLLAVSTMLLLLAYLKTQTPLLRIFSFAGVQLSMIGIISLIILAMECSGMLALQIYLGYVAISTPVIILFPRMYYKILIRRFNAKPVSDIVSWPQEFANELAGGAKVYYFDSAVPKAFTSGKAIFVSLGMLELFSEDEIKAVLAHEIWHFRNRAKTPVLRQLSAMTFTRYKSEPELEVLADEFAQKVVSKDALESARKQVEN
ncbi:heat shock protein HtpX [Methanohalophilus levihalophilus]|uniref:M48 family metalloprotease n=1 Tax=Methanohalophilus levihalophilus TaxID=1431282 RepID=UPI001AE53163|nr:M48 family metalloprotease [Methanohalophilus levihalophilus]MBP2031274.1 heat shock protein HtpX [Methanohalophilus levihalophilus]